MDVVVTTNQPFSETKKKPTIISQNGNLTKPTGKKFRSLCSDRVTQKNNISTDKFTDALISIEEECIAKNTTSSRENKQWFNEDCRKAINLKKAALRKFNKELATRNLKEYKVHIAKVRKNIEGSPKGMLARICQQNQHFH